MRFDYIYGGDASDRYPDVKVTIEEITPETAALMLEANVMNRNRKREPLAEAMLKGEWRLNGASIVFSKDGVLLDGQNRLMACVSSGVPIVSIVVRGAEPESQMTMDTGVKRQLGDYLKMAGYRNAEKVAAIGVALYRKDKGHVSFERKGSGNVATIRTLYDYTTGVYEDRIEPIMSQCRAVASRFRLSVHNIASLFDSFREASDDDFNEFVSQMLGNSTQCQPVQKLVAQLDKNNARGTKSKLTNRVIAAYIVKAWNAYMKGEEIAFLRFSSGGAHPEAFPEIFTGYSE